MPETSSPAPFCFDVLIFGGGCAGLWLLDDLVREGRRCLLLEARALGSGQTVGSQGIIHSGVKYTLKGLLDSVVNVIGRMPGVWRDCLAGKAEPDLSAVRLRDGRCLLWRTDSLKSKLGMLGASAAMRVRPEPLAPEDRPPLLRDCPGKVFTLAEQVIDPRSFLEVLAGRHADRLLKIDAESGLAIELSKDDATVRLKRPGSGGEVELRAKRLVFAAGAGNASLREKAGLSANAMQRRPLHMAVVRGDLPALNGHCVDGDRTRVTVTTDRLPDGRTAWQVGGQVAEDGVRVEPRDLAAHVRKELEAVLPGLDLAGMEWTTYRVDRAEAVWAGGLRPDDATVIDDGPAITCWPTKLALAPRASELVRAKLPAPSEGLAEPPAALADWPRPAVALPPWREEAAEWFAAS